MALSQPLARRTERGRRDRGAVWHRPNTRQAILDAARALIAEEGLERTSLIRVAERAGFAPPTVYAYFVRKADLVASLVADDLAVFARNIAHCFPATPSIDPVEVSEDAMADSPPEETAIISAHEIAMSPSESAQTKKNHETANGIDDASPGEAHPHADIVPEQPAASLAEESASDAAIAPDGTSATTDAASEAEERSHDPAPDAILHEQTASDAPSAVMEADHIAPAAPETETMDLDEAHEDVPATPADDHPPAPRAEESSVASAVGEEIASDGEASDTNVAAEIADAAHDEASEPAPDGKLATLEARIAQIEARRADPWLERRLREFERMLAVLEERVTSAEKLNTEASAPLESRLSDLVARVEAFEKAQGEALEENVKALTQKLEATEARLRQTAAELRTLTLEASGRIDILERDRELKALAVEMPTVVPAAEQRTQDTPAKTPEPADASDADESYLVAARRAALAAHSLAQSERDTVALPRLSSIKPGARALIGLCAGVGVVVVGASIALKAHGPASHSVVLPAAEQSVHVRHRSVPHAVLMPPAPAKDAHAELQMGLSYLNGAGVTRDNVQAVRLLTSSASAGNAVAEYWLGTLFEHGRGEPTDETEAVRWYEASALQGNVKAMYKLAVSYAEGWGTQQNYSEAARWFSRAGEFGFVNAQYNLGVLYERGLGVPQSLLDAYKWYALAASQGDGESAGRVDALASQLSPEDLATGRQAVAVFKPQTPDLAANPPAVAAQAPASGPPAVPHG